MTDPADPAPDTARLTDDDRAAVRRVLSQMPYLPTVPTAGFRMSPVTVADLVTLLAEFAEVLHRVGDENNDLEEAHRQLRRDVAAMRRVLGTHPSGTIQIPTGPGSSVEITDNRFGVGADTSPAG